MQAGWIERLKDDQQMQDGALPSPPEPPLAAFAAWLAGWWRMVQVAAVAAVLALSPASYGPARRRAMALQIYLAGWRTLPWFALLSALLSLVVIHVVVVTARSYGLSQFALETVVRVLVVEVLPLAAALFVALGAGAVSGGGIAALAEGAQLPPPRAGAGIARCCHHFLPAMMAAGFTVIALVAVSGALALALAYLEVYGVSPWGLPDYTRTVGRVFHPVAALVFGLKTLAFAAAVATVPVAAAIAGSGRRQDPAAAFLGGTLRLFFVLIAIEAASLAVNFA